MSRIGTDDLFAGIKLAVASFIVLPLLPNEPVDPWQALNPYKLWLLVILISALSLVGYVAMRWLGTARGAAVSGLTGGLVSSTAATLSFARTSRDEPQGHALSAAVLLAWSVMFVRLAILVAVVNRTLLLAAWPPLAAMGAVTVAFALWHYRAGVADAGSQAAVTVSNPFSLTAAIRFGALFAAMLLVVQIVQQRAPGVGTYVVAALAGVIDTDAIALSLAEGAQAGSGTATALAIAVLANTLSKCGLVLVLGRGAIRRQVGIATAAIVIAGVPAIALATP